MIEQFVLSDLVSPTLQCVTVAAGTANVMTERNLRTSQKFGLLTVASVAADFGWRYSQHLHDPKLLVGTIVYGVVAARLGLIIAHDFSDRARLGIVAGSYAASSGTSTVAQIILDHGFNPWTALPLVAGAVGCVADYAKDQNPAIGESSHKRVPAIVIRRRCHVVVGACSTIYGLATGNYGLAIKALVADLGAGTAASMRYKDPLPTIHGAWHMSQRITAQGNALLHPWRAKARGLVPVSTSSPHPAH